MAKKYWKYTRTNYRQKWLDFRRSKEYDDISIILRDKGIRQPYRDNIMKTLFCQGWNSANGEIHFID